MNEQQRRRRGFVLLLTLVYVALAALVMVGTARQSCAVALEAAERQERLQRQWGELSCKRALLRRAEAVLRTHEESQDEDRADERPRVSPALTGDVMLGDLQLSLRLADENAKVNLNTVYTSGGEERLREMLRSLTRQTRNLPIKPDRTLLDQRKKLSSLGHVFDLSRAESPGVMADSLAAATEHVTCWGDGKLNIDRAPDHSLRSVCELAVGSHDADRLIELRQEHPDWDLFVLLNNLQLRYEERQKLEQLLRQGSGCHSLWIEVSGANRNWHSLHVTGAGAAGHGNMVNFIW